VLVTLLPFFLFSKNVHSRIYEQSRYTINERRMTSSIAEQVKRRRDLDQVRTAIEARRYTGRETLIMGLKLSALALRIAGGR
jgi:hypothetical protein